MQAIGGFNQTLWQGPFDQGLLSFVRSSSYAGLLPELNALAAQRGLVSGQDKPLQFVAQELLPSSKAYETFIAQTGCVPTRDKFHDRYNALMWFTAPKTKALLNRLQHEEIARLGGVTKRGPVRDALTLWDENLAVLVAHNHSGLLTSLLKARDWPALFVEHRSKWQLDWRVRLFGHALMEKLDTPYKSITAHVLILQSPSADWTIIDSMLFDWLSNPLQQAALTPRVFLPLPVMGIPGWCVENEDFGFYCDTEIFRKPREAGQFTN
jgi:hypothetical protein